MRYQDLVKGFLISQVRHQGFILSLFLFPLCSLSFCFCSLSSALINSCFSNVYCFKKIRMCQSPSLHRFMVGCSSSADSPGEVKFHVMDEQPPLPLSQPTPAAVTVQLRIAEGNFSLTSVFCSSTRS